MELSRKVKIRVLLLVLFISIIVWWVYAPGDKSVRVVRLLGLVAILVALALTREGRSYEKYEYDPSRSWLVVGLALVCLSIVPLYVMRYATNLGYDDAWAVGAVMSISIMVGGLLSIRKSRRRGGLDRLIRRPFRCPICRTKLERMNRACYGCGAVVWSVPKGRASHFPFDEVI